VSILCVIQARYSSTRFPGKALADLNGKPVIQHVIERANKIATVDRVVLAIPMGEAEEPLLEWAIENRVDYLGVHGPVNDVLARFVRAAEYAPEAHTFVRLTGDCPLMQPEVCRSLLRKWRASGCEYGWVDTQCLGGWADGLDVEVFTRALLFRASQRATEPYDREHVTPWMRRNADVYSMPLDSYYNDWPKVSIDTEDDLRRVREFSRRPVVA
jgi:spore coat polysaccharide biosynthesis protein SpsF